MPFCSGDTLIFGLAYSCVHGFVGFRGGGAQVRLAEACAAVDPFRFDAGVESRRGVYG